MEQAPLGYQQDFDRKDVTRFARAVEALQPGASGRSIAKLLDGRVTRHCALNWKAGRRQAPKWALDILAAKIRARTMMPLAIAAEIDRAKERPGKQAGAINLAVYLARPR